MIPLEILNALIGRLDTTVLRDRTDAEPHNEQVTVSTTLIRECAEVARQLREVMIDEEPGTVA